MLIEITCSKVTEYTDWKIGSKCKCVPTQFWLVMISKVRKYNITIEQVTRKLIKKLVSLVAYRAISDCWYQVHISSKSNAIKGCVVSSIDYQYIDKNPPFSGLKNGTEGKKDQYLDRNDYSAQPDANALSGANKCKEQDAIFDGIMLTPLFAALRSLVTT